MVTSQLLFLGFLGLLAAERCFELVLSRVHARAGREHGAVEVGQRNFRVMAALHVAFFASCGAEVLVLSRPFPGTLGYVALGVALAAQALRYSAVGALGQQWNVRIIVWPRAAPVTRGPYRFVRHPNYVAVGLEILFVPLIHGAFLTAAVFSVCNALVLAVRIREEERALGEPYAEAFRDRPRLIPRFFRG